MNGSKMRSHVEERSYVHATAHSAVSTVFYASLAAAMTGTCHAGHEPSLHGSSKVYQMTLSYLKIERGRDEGKGK